MDAENKPPTVESRVDELLAATHAINTGASQEEVQELLAKIIRVENLYVQQTMEAGARNADQRNDVLQAMGWAVECIDRYSKESVVQLQAHMRFIQAIICNPKARRKEGEWFDPNFRLEVGE